MTGNTSVANLSRIILAFLCLAVPAVSAQQVHRDPPIQLAQGNCKSLADAVEQIRRQTGGRIISATTTVKNGREVHQIKVLSDDGKVKTHKVQGCKRNNR